jgi:DNA-binding transcriptional MocR family regulator
MTGTARSPQLALADFIGEGHLARHVRRMRRL